VGAGQAQAVAVAAVPGSGTMTIGAPRLVYFNAGLLSAGATTNTRLAWRVHVRGVIDSEGIGSSWLVFVDAHDGTVLLVSEQSPAARRITISTAANTRPANACYVEGGAVEQWITEDGPTAAYPGGDADADAAALAANATYDFYSGLDRDSYDDEGARIEVFVHAGDPRWGNAKWSAQCLQMLIADGMVAKASDTSPPTSAIIAGPPPLYGTCVVFTPVRLLKSSPARCAAEPLPDEE
jgi:hypothetical protein